jgi:hypothetical protein
VWKYDEIDADVSLIVEFERLKGEQNQRISTRDNVVHAPPVPVAGVGAHQARMLLLAPHGTALGWVYPTGEEKISAPGRRVSALVNDLPQPAGNPHSACGNARRTDQRGRTRKVIQRCAGLLAFRIPTLISIVVRRARRRTLDLDNHGSDSRHYAGFDSRVAGHHQRRSPAGQIMERGRCRCPLPPPRSRATSGRRGRRR